MPVRDLTVVRIGTDTSGRGIYMTKWMLEVWEAIKRHPDVRPFAWKLVIVQGAFMTRNGGGAAASAGYHDLAGSLDVRTWNLTTAELNAFIKVSRMAAFAFWRRDESYLHGGMSPHAHGTLGSDAPLTSGALASWNGYLRNQNGLASGRADYEWRPSPLVTYPPDTFFEEDDYMATDDAQAKLDRILKEVQEGNKTLAQFKNAEWQRDKNELKRARDSKAELVTAIGGFMDMLVELDNKLDDAAGDNTDVKKLVRRSFRQLRDQLAADPDVDGAENPGDITQEG